MPASEVEVDSSLIFALSEGIGPRPPTSNQEHVAAEVIAGEFEELGPSSKIEYFDSQRSFGPTYLVMFLIALLAGPLARRSRLAGTLAGLVAPALGAAESRFALRSPLNLLRTRRSQNVWSVIEPESAPQQTICLVSHMDSSRSGLMFHPRFTPYLGRASFAAGVALMLNGVAPLISWMPPGRLLVKAARGLIGLSALLVLERELRGEDVPGANDNASGVAACLNLARQFDGDRLEHSRLVILVTGSEESGVIGMREFLRRNDTGGWIFINFDGVSADAPLRVLSREGGPTGSKADPDLMATAERVGRKHPELAAEPLLDGSGLPYDATAVNARGGRAITIANQSGAILNYHWPTDSAANISEPAFAKAVRFAAALVEELDGEA